MTAPSFRIREADPADFQDLIELMGALQAYEAAMEPNRLSAEASAEPHMRALDDWAWRSGGAVLLATADHDGAPLGFIVFGIDEEFGSFVLPENKRYGVVSDLFVYERARGQGIARALIGEAEAFLREKGLSRIEISALWANDGARATYAALGYAHAHLTFAKALR
ncbi:MAG: GNAT family N-acetyltransferase [Pseudomonadota bacterium]